MYIRSQQYHTPPAYSGITVPSSPPPDRRNGNAAGRPASDGAEPSEAARLTGDAAGAMSGTLPGPALPTLPGAIPREKNSSPFYPVSDGFTAADFADRRKRVAGSECL